MVYRGNPDGRVCVGRRWRELQAQVYAEEDVCWRCGLGVEMLLREVDPNHNDAPSVDHVIPKVIAPHLALVRSNLRLAHRRCNSSRGARVAPTAKATRSQRW